MVGAAWKRGDWGSSGSEDQDTLKRGHQTNHAARDAGFDTSPKGNLLLTANGR